MDRPHATADDLRAEPAETTGRSSMGDPASGHGTPLGASRHRRSAAPDRRAERGGRWLTLSGRLPVRSGRRRDVRRLLAACTVVVVLAGLAVAWVGLRGARAAEHLQAAGGLFRQLQAEVQRGDLDTARITLTALQRETTAARAETGDIGWRLGGHAPSVGDDMTAVRTVAVTLDDLANQGLPPLLDTAGSLGLASLAPTNGRIDLSVVQKAAPQIAEAAAAVRIARERINSIDPDALVSRLRTGVLELRHGLDRAAAMTGSATRMAALLPSMMGANGPRTYLLLIQNLAEARATGGMPGAFVVIGADHGAVKIVDQGSASGTLIAFDNPVVPLDPAMRALYTDRLGEYPADVNLTPHFPTAATTAREMYRLRTGRTVDGVMATDPVALSYLLGVTGPIAMPGGGSLTAGNAVQSLLSTVYATVRTPASQDQFFAAAARGAFEALTGRTPDMAGLVTQLARAAGERRVLVWSSNPAEQKLIEGTTLEGALPITDGTRPTVGVFLNDGTAAKMSYYLDHSADVSVQECRPDGSARLRVMVTLTSTAPSGGLPPDVLGLSLAGKPYTIRTNISLFSPTGGTVDDVRLDGATAPLKLGKERRRSVGIVTVDLAPGASRTVEATMLTGIPKSGAGPTQAPTLWTSPGVTPWELNVHSAEVCRTKR